MRVRHEVIKFTEAFGEFIYFGNKRRISDNRRTPFFSNWIIKLT